MRKLANLFVFTVTLALCVQASAQDRTLTLPDVNWEVFTGTHDELLARRAAATKLFSAQSLAHGWAGLTPASYSAPYAARQVFSDPYYISEEVDCTQSDGLNATAWNDGYGMYLGQYATIDGVEVQTFTYAEAVSIEDAPMICQVYFQDLFCGTEAEWWPAICQEAGYCCPLDA